MSFRITPEDVGRKCKFRCGTEGRVINFRLGEVQPVVAIDADGLKSSHNFDGSFYSDLKESKWDIIAWADEPATDQVADHVRPKDLRDEFAMSVVASIVGSQDYYEMPNPEKSKWVDRVALYAYEFADAMIRARGK